MRQSDRWLSTKLRAKKWLASITRRGMGRHVEALMTRSGEFVYLVHPSDFSVGRQLRYRGCYGNEELERLTKLLDKDSRLLIVGGHVGTIAIPASKACRSVDVIEANPVTADLLEKNIALNHCHNVTLHRFAAGDRDGTIEFLAASTNSGGSKIKPRTDSPLYRIDADQQITVPMRQLDEIFDERQFDVILMDIEGAEVMAMNGMRRLIDRCDDFIVEFVPHHLRNVANASVEDFLRPLADFESMMMSGGETHTGTRQHYKILQNCFEHDVSDDSVHFSRRSQSSAKAAA